MYFYFFSSNFARIYLNSGSATTQCHPTDAARCRHRVLRHDPAARIRRQRIQRIIRFRRIRSEAVRLEQQQHRGEQCQMQAGGEGLLGRDGRIRFESRRPGLSD